MHLQEKIIQSVFESRIRGATLRGIHSGLDSEVPSVAKLRVILRGMVRDGELQFRSGRYFVENEAISGTESNSHGYQSSGSFDFDDLRKICKFYSAVVDRTKGSSLEFSPEDSALNAELNGSVDWGLFSRQPIKIKREFLPDRGSRINKGRATFCGPFERVLIRRSNREAWVPVFVIQAKVSSTANELIFEQLDGIEVNPRWLDIHAKNEEERNHLLIRLGFAEEIEGEFSRVPCQNLNNAWNLLSQNVSEIRWQNTAVLSSLDRPQNFKGQRSLGVYPGVLCLPWSKPGYGWGEIMEELKEISEQPDSVLKQTALRHYVNQTSETASKTSDLEDSLLSLDPLNYLQKQALKRSQEENLVVVQGPPGTGKSTVVRNMLLNQASRQKTVIFCSQNHKALDAVVPTVNSASGKAPVIFDLRDKQSGLTWVQQLSNNLNGNYPDEIKGLEQLKKEAENILGELENYEKSLHEVQILRDQYTEASLFITSLRLEIGRDIEILENIVFPFSNDYYRSAFNNKEFRWYSIRSWIHEWKRRGIIKQLASINPATQRVSRKSLFNFSEFLTAKDNERSLERRISDSDSLGEISDRIIELEKRLSPIMTDLVDLVPCQFSHSVSDFYRNLQNVADAFRRRKSNRKRFLDTCRECLPALLPGMPAWACTNQSVPTRIPMVPGLFDLCVIDEAAQCDPISVIPILFRSRRAVIVGDPKQLPPIASLGFEKEDQIRQKFDVMDDKYNRFMTSRGASAYDLSQGALRENKGKEGMLREHYRCHPQIATFFNDEFYAGRLIVRTRTNRGRFEGPRIRWTHVPGGMERIGPSLWWKDQCNSIIDELEKLARIGFEGSVGVVTPFSEHAKRINDQAYSVVGINQLNQWKFLSGTVDKFQGGEKDIILFGMIGGGEGPRPTPQFYSRDLRRFNVALSRGKDSLHIFGDQSWAKNSGVPVIENLFLYVDSLKKQEAANNSEIRTDLIGPVWEPLLAKKLEESEIECVPQYYSCGYYLDFAIFNNGQKINIEVDGETYHRNEDEALRQEDVSRDQVLKADGWRVQRFWVYELREDMEKCLNMIKSIMK